LKAAGALVPPQRGQSSQPGTEFAEFRRLKAPEQGYVLTVPPSVLPMPAGMRPTVLLDRDRGVAAFAIAPATARPALGTPGPDRAGWRSGPGAGRPARSQGLAAGLPGHPAGAGPVHRLRGHAPPTRRARRAGPVPTPVPAPARSRRHPRRRGDAAASLPLEVH